LYQLGRIQQAVISTTRAVKFAADDASRAKYLKTLKQLKALEAKQKT
jgi:hypothetical protein